MKKNGFLTFCFACIPGAGQMYYGYMKRGLSLITLFCIGVGLGAASLLSNIRYTNTGELYAYLEGSACLRPGLWENPKEDGQTEELPAVNLHVSVERIDRRGQMEEFMFLGLRMMDGISRQEFEECFGVPIEAVYQETMAHLQEEGLLIKRAGRIYLSERGQEVSNYALAQFLS